MCSGCVPIPSSNKVAWLLTYSSLNQLTLNTDLERRLLPKVLELVRSPDGHRICLGNWSTVQLEALADALTESDTAAAIEAVLLDISRHLVQRIDSIWEQRKQAKFLEAAASLSSADPALLRYFQRKFKPYSPRPVAAPHAFYGVRLGHILGVYLGGRTRSCRPSASTAM